MATPKRPSGDRARLPALTREFAVATADFATQEIYKPLTQFLAQVREALGMDIAFVSQIEGDRRVFRVISMAAQESLPVAVGDSDPLVDSYCQRVLEGRLPHAIADTALSAEAQSLEITERLQIGAYLSVPIVTRDGGVFGTLCCFSHAARPGLGDDDVAALRNVADAVAASIERGGGLRENIWAG
jgi:GAF domain-containing protein